ncbi:MAG: sulfatase, partial [Planctomycetota bacterium]
MTELTTKRILQVKKGYLNMIDPGAISNDTHLYKPRASSLCGVLPRFRGLFLLVLCFFSACSQAPPWVNVGGPLILITVDTLRADHLSCYGYTALSTPRFDMLAKEGVLFADTSTTMPMTLPAHATIMTGLTPPVHGVRDNQDYFLPDSAVTLAERFAEAGFETAGFISSFVLDSVYGMSQGFSHFSPARDVRYDLGLDKQKDAATVTEEAIQWIRGAKNDRFFIWIHYFDPHEKCAPPQEFLPPGRHPYDGEIAFVDDRLGRLFTELKRRDLYDDATIIVTADHGEGLGEHGERTHGFLTYQGTIKVPLIIKSPGIRPGRVDQPVSLADIFPTALDLFGLKREKNATDGASLVPFLVEQGKVDPRLVYFESYLPTLYMGWSGQRGVRLGSLKYIESSMPELYELTDDPLERKNLFNMDNADSTQLRQMLLRFREAVRNRNLEAPAQEVHERNKAEWLNRLIALGYIGGSTLSDKELERVEGRIQPSLHVTDYESFLADYVEGSVNEMQNDFSADLILYNLA